MIIKNLCARKILNSRGEETIEITVETPSKAVCASAPGGKSKGKNEAPAFSSKGINFSVDFANLLGKKLIQDCETFNEFSDLEKIEKAVKCFDKTENFSLLGANALFAIESAVLKAIAASQEIPLWKLLNEKPKILPRPLGNCIGGGAHVNHEEAKTDFQEFLLLPKTKHFFDAYFINMQAYKEAKRVLSEKDTGWRGDINDENALASTLDNEKVLQLLSDIVKRINDSFEIKIDLGLDVASSHLWGAANYVYKNFPDSKKLTKDKQIEYIAELIEKYNLAYVEDPLNEEDFNGFSRLARLVHKKNPKCLICGDDLICTQKERLEKAIKESAINSVIIKPNQNGSLLQTKEVLDLAKKHSITPIISHRSGETMDNTIASLAVAWDIPIIKTGILGKERFAKLHELLRIERSLGIK